MLTVQWQPLTLDLGAEIPEEVTEAGCGDLYARALERSRAEYERLRGAGHAEAAPTPCLGYRIRYVLDLNAREAMHLTELRSAREGHASYRAVAQAMHTAIADVHPAVAATMSYVDHSTEPRLERILSEIRGESRRASLTLSTRATNKKKKKKKKKKKHDGRGRGARAAKAGSAALVARDAGALRALHHERFRFTTPRGDVGPRRSTSLATPAASWCGTRRRSTTPRSTSWATPRCRPRSPATSRARRRRGAHAMRLTLTSDAEAGGWRSPGTRGQRSDLRVGPGPIGPHPLAGSGRYGGYGNARPIRQGSGRGRNGRRRPPADP